MKNKWILLVIVLFALIVGTGSVLAESHKIFYEYSEKIDCNGWDCSSHRFSRVMDTELNIVCYWVGSSGYNISCLQLGTK